MKWLDKKLDLVYPFLLALFPWLYVFSKYIKDFSYSILWIPLLSALGITIGLVFLLKFIFKNDRKAFLLIAFGILGVLYYGFFYEIFFGLKVNGFLLGRHRYLYPFWGVLFSVIGIYIIMTKKSLMRVITGFKYAAFLLFIIPLISIASHEIKNWGLDSAQQVVNKTEESKDDPKIPKVSSSLNKSDLPDIYYILPDQYARLDVLKEYFNYDSKEFSGFLVKKGFAIADKSRSNYSITLFSLPSTLNMEYIDRLITLPSEDSTDFDPLVEKIKSNTVKSLVESLGYRYIYLSSDALVVGAKDTGDDIIESNLDTYMRQTLKTTILRPFGGRYSFKEKNINKWARKSVLDTFDQLSKVPTSNLAGPKFVFAHIMAPHGPYVFGRNGEETKLNLVKSMTYQEDMAAFLDQSVFVSKKISEVVDSILANSKTPPIIIIQSDHGHYLDRELVSEDLRRDIRSRNFTAIYMPGKSKASVPRDITTVNTFRLIFDQYFGTKLGQLENKSFIYDGQRPFKFVEIVYGK